MTPKTLFTAALLMIGLSAQAQQQAGTGKLFIINDANRATLTSATNPAAVLSQTDRVELTSNNSLVSVKRCGALGCLDPVGTPVRLEAIHHVNQDLRAADVGGDGDHGCRVCINTKTISTDLEEYVERVKTEAPKFDNK